MMKTIKYVTLIVMLFAASDVFANESTGEVQITQITNWVGTVNSPSENLFIKTDQTLNTNPSGCTNSSQYILLGSSTISRSMLLTAFTAKIKLALTIAGGGCSSDNRPLIAAITLLN